jgi:type I restriction enzyme R subunit
VRSLAFAIPPLEPISSITLLLLAFLVWKMTDQGNVQIDQGKTNIGLGVRVGLHGITAVGSGEKRDPTMVAFQQVLDRLNELFGSEDFTEGQKVSFLEALLRTLRDNAELVQQAKVNSIGQFTESPDFDYAFTSAAADNGGANQKMTEYVFSDAPGRPALVADFAKLFYEWVRSDGEEGA